MSQVVGQRDGLGQVLVERKARAMFRVITATSMVWVNRVRRWSPVPLRNTWVLYSNRRKARLWITRSRSR
jgi:hypothetical protein